MDNCVRRMRSGCLSAFSVIVLSALGCHGGDPDAIPAVQAGGTVSFKGKPIESGDVTFVPAKGRSAHGSITNGEFTLSTYAEGDGAIPGKHRVAVTATKEVKITKGSNKGETDRVPLLPKDYGSPEFSKIEVDIPAEGNTQIKLELK